MSHFFVRILVQKHNFSIFLQKWTMSCRYCQCRSLLDHVEPFFCSPKIEEENIGNIWFQKDGATCHTPEVTVDVFPPIFEDRINSRRADVVYPHRRCDLTPMDYYLWGADKDKCNADKPAAIAAIKDNMREVTTRNG